jgi:transposase
MGNPDPQTLPDDPAVLRRMLAEALTALKERDEKIEKLSHCLEQLRRHQFGRRSEQLSPDQMLFPFTAQSFPAEHPRPTAEPKPNGNGKAGHGRKPLPPNLPRIPVVHDVPPAERRCRECDRELVRIGEEVAEQLEYKPASFHVLRHVRPKYACKACQANVVIAEPPPAPIEKGIPGPGVLAHLVVSKYADHLPLYRQQAIFERHGVEVARTTLCGWVGRVADLLRPIYDAMVLDVLSSKVLHTDDTPVPVLDPELDRTREGRLWVYVGDRDHAQTVYQFSPNRERVWPQEFLSAYRGYLQADAYQGYDKLFTGGTIVEVGCWAHARRYFYDAQTSDRTRSLVALSYIGELYRVEEEAKELPSDDRRKLRQERSRPILECFEKWMTTESLSLLPQSPITEAMTYARQQWKALSRYVEDGDLAIDNNAAERALRAVAVGRKNWLFAGNDEGGERAAVLYSLVASCKQSGVEPFHYIRAVLEQVSTHPARAVAELMPRRWIHPSPS